MKQKQLIRCLLAIALTLIIGICYGKSTPQISIVDNPTLLKTAQTLPNSGVLKVADDDFVYIQVSHDFVTKLFPLLVKNLPPEERSCITPDNAEPGAHITLFYDSVLNQQQIKQLPVGQSFNFQVTQAGKIQVKTKYKHKKISTVWYFIMLNSPELNTVLQQFPEQKSTPELHISIARAKYNPDGSCILPH